MCMAKYRKNNYLSQIEREKEWLTKNVDNDTCVCVRVHVIHSNAFLSAAVLNFLNMLEKKSMKTRETERFEWKQRKKRNPSGVEEKNRKNRSIANIHFNLNAISYRFAMKSSGRMYGIIREMKMQQHYECGSIQKLDQRTQFAPYNLSFSLSKAKYVSIRMIMIKHTR